MTKDFPIREMMNMQVRLSATNVFNTPYFNSLNTVVGTPTFGQVTGVGPMRRMTVQMRFRF
jgi:outer membrane receptor protein involved in Fe transport